jgi:hypothetical protein
VTKERRETLGDETATRGRQAEDSIPQGEGTLSKPFAETVVADILTTTVRSASVHDGEVIAAR